MISVVFATSNAHKLEEFRSALEQTLLAGKIRVLSLRDIAYQGEIVESGTTFEENALIKARAIASPNYIAVADDSGLTVDALGGAPGIYSARYAGTHGDDAANNRRLLAELDGCRNRSAAFVCCIACVLPDGTSFTVRGICRGEILDTLRGADGFGYDPLFYCPRLAKTFAELTQDEKNEISHRGNAVRLFADALLARGWGL